MRKKLGLGAGFALTAAVIAIGGCGSKKTTINSAPGGELNNNGFPASSIAQNNLASDGGGFSENNQSASFGRFTCKFNFKHPESDAASSADNSGMFFFVTADNGSTSPTNREHVFISYWNGSSFTAPQEITGEDRDESLPVNDARGTHAAATIMIPMNTSSYVGNTGTANARVRANAGNWLILWDGNTFTQNQVLVGSSGTAGILQGSAIGPHHTVWATVFIKNLASQPLATTNLIGNTATTGTANGPAITCFNGFQQIGTQISTYRNGASAAGQNVGATGIVAGFQTAGGQLVKPAEDIVVSAAATDTFVHCAHFKSSLTNANQDISGLAAGGKLGNVGGSFHFGPNTSGPATTVTINSADYEVGDNTSFIQLFWVQLVTSGTGLTRVSTAFAPTSSNATIQLGPTYNLLTANFNLATMTVGGGATPFLAADAATPTQAVVSAPATRNTFTDARRASTQPYGELFAYNNILFWNYRDTSLGTGASTGAFEATIINNGSKVLSTVAVLPGANGDATIGNQNDVTLLGSAGKHQILNDTTNVANGIVVGEENVGFNVCGESCPVIGPDEGQVDIVAFVLGQITTFGTRGGGTLNNNDDELWAVALQATGATAGTLEAFTNNPKRVSTHVADLPKQTTTNSANTNFADRVGDFKMNISRDGTYAVLAWRQVQGTSESANLALVATVYKEFRATAATGSSTVTVPTLDQRFPSTNPIVVNTAATVAYSGQFANLGSNGGFTGSPVAAYDFQGHISYKCGFQGDRTKMSILWLYSDGTEDRLFIKLLTIGTGTAVTDAPTIAASNEAEVDSTAAVPGRGVNLTPTLVTTSLKSTFRFLPASFGETIPTYSSTNGASFGCSSLSDSDSDQVESVDAGVNAAGAGGDVLIVFSKTVAATDNNWDRQIIAALYNQTTVSDRVVISRTGVESTGQQPGGTSNRTIPNAGGIGSSGTYPFVTGFKTVLWGLLPNTSSSSISTAAKVADNGTYIYFGGPATNNASSARALYTRHFRARKATGSGTAVTFANTFFPAASASTGDAAFKQPVRIDKQQNSSDATPVETFKKGRTAIVVFKQDNHLWGTQTSDGESYTSTGGQSDAFLVDNNISANQNSGSVPSTHACELFDSNCDNLSKTALFFIKEDVNLNQRIYVRVMQ